MSAANQENYTIELSQVAIEKTCGIKKAAYNSAVQELIDKKFLVLSNPDKFKTSPSPCRGVLTNERPPKVYYLLKMSLKPRRGEKRI